MEGATDWQKGRTVEMEAYVFVFPQSEHLASLHRSMQATFGKEKEKVTLAGVTNQRQKAFETRRIRRPCSSVVRRCFRVGGHLGLILDVARSTSSGTTSTNIATEHVHSPSHPPRLHSTGTLISYNCINENENPSTKQQQGAPTTMSSLVKTLEIIRLS